MHEKSEVTKHFKVFVARTELETGHSLKVLHLDGGGEYTTGEMQQFIKDKGIKHEMMTADTPQHNGVAEHMNRTLIEQVQTMLIDAALPESYWEYALHYTALLHNISPLCSLNQATPEEAWSGNKPDVSQLRTFGCRAFVHIPNSQRSKLAAKSLVCTFLGYARQQKAYHLVHRPTGCFLDSHDVMFDEGGTVPSFEQIVLEPVLLPDTPDASPPLSAPPAVQITAPAPTTAPTPTTTAPPLPSSRPKCTTRALIHNDDPRYTVTS
jgi:hypothetical protein